MAEATIHLVCGSTGAGKTTPRPAALQATGRDALLRRRLDGGLVRARYAATRRLDVGIAERAARCESQIVATALQLGRLTVTRAMFDFIESLWQPPGADEMAALDGVRIGS